MLGFFIGAVSGAIQFYLLLKFTTSLSGGKMGTRTLIFAITQFLFPFAVLVACAFLLSDALMWVGIGMAASLIICAVVKFVLTSKAKNK